MGSLSVKAARKHVGEIDPSAFLVTLKTSLLNGFSKGFVKFSIIINLGRKPWLKPIYVRCYVFVLHGKSEDFKNFKIFATLI